MGRWGHRLFEGDRDIDIAVDLNSAFGERDDNSDDDFHPSAMVHQTDMLAPNEAREHYKTKEYLEKELPEIVEKNRKMLDSGMGDKLFEMYRPREHEWRGKYRVILIGALVMRAGAKIKDDDMQHLRDLLPGIPSREGFAWPLHDEGFRGPGKRQFMAALDNYTPGTPRDYQIPSCFGCGKTRVDTGKEPTQCSKCRRAWYCDSDCQKNHWKDHKSSCIALEKSHMINV